jgi:hypothetical protein
MEQEHDHRREDLGERARDRLRRGQEQVEAEIEEQAVHEAPDEQTSREALELDLMADDDSAEGEEIGEHID